MLDQFLYRVHGINFDDCAKENQLLSDDVCKRKAERAHAKIPFTEQVLPTRKSKKRITFLIDDEVMLPEKEEELGVPKAEVKLPLQKEKVSVVSTTSSSTLSKPKKVPLPKDFKERMEILRKIR